MREGDDVPEPSCARGPSASGRLPTIAVALVFAVGCTDAPTIELEDMNQPPSATATATPVRGAAPLEVTFDVSGSTDADGTIVEYVWDFGDGGARGDGPSPSHAYVMPGTYTVRLTVTDDDGATATAEIDITVEPSWPAAGWPTATPPEMGMDGGKLLEARDYAVETNGGGGSGLVARGGRVVVTWGDVDRLWEVKSITKAIGVTLLGLTIADGLMGLEDPAQLHHSGLGVPPEANADTGWLDDIRVLDLAAHTAGFETTAGYGALIHAPRTVFSYSDGGYNWLGEAVTLAFGQDALSVLQSRVLSPLGVSSAHLSWRDHAYRDQEIAGITRREFGSGVSTSVDVLARLGYLYLRDGAWNGSEILPSSYVETATAPIPGLATLPSPDPKYPGAPARHGLSWWNNADGSMPGVPIDTFFAWGLNDGLIVVIPSLDVVATRLGDPWRTSGQDPHYPVVEPFIRSIVESVLDP